MASTVWWSTLYLGNLPAMDTIDGSLSYEIETAAPLLQTFGGDGAPLAKQIVDVQSYSADTNTQISTDNNLTNDTVTYNLGSGAVTVKVDAVVAVHGTVTFYDGSTYTATFGTFQTVNGDTFMLVLDSQPELASAGISSVTFDSVVSSNYANIEQTTKDDHDFVCFGPGSRIATPFGPRRADKLKVGDLVTTLDDGPQPIRWIGKRRLTFETPHPAQPVRIGQNAFGGGLPKRDVMLSPNHRVLVDTRPTHALHDPLGALAPVKALTRSKGIRFAAGRRAITYFSFLLPLHAVLVVEGIGAESLFPGPRVWAQLTGPERSDWLRLAGQARVTGIPPARLMLSAGEARNGLDVGGLTLPAAAPTVVGWSARTRRAGRPLPLHLAAGAPGAPGPGRALFEPR